MKIFQVDAFASGPFTGNPAAVCLVDKPIESELMQQIAMEMNLAETAFVQPAAEGFDLRWFTPTVEVDLCGHATLATAHILWETGVLDKTSVASFNSRSGILRASLQANGIELDFPSQPPKPVSPPAVLCPALGVTPVYVGYNGTDYFVVVADAYTVKSINPDLRALATLEMRGVIVTAEDASPDTDFISRFFAPGAGVDEDPVTGSAHCCLAPYWRDQLGKDTMQAWQASARGGRLTVTVAGDRVKLLGQAVTMLGNWLTCK